MDFQNRVGHKTGSGAPASAQDIALERKERLRKLAMETIDLSKDPYMMRNHLGGVECKLCLTLHTNEASYLSHTQGKKHQTNLARRSQKEKTDSSIAPQPKKVFFRNSLTAIFLSVTRLVKRQEFATCSY
jgi:splicing factor 3A subunit 2